MPEPGIKATAGIARWCARIAALGVVLFFVLFAIRPEQGSEGFIGRFMQLLPALICTALLVLSWKRPLIGMLGFLALALIYAWWARDRWDWVLAISGPLLLVAGFHAWAWIASRKG
jgi:hypothetical protein